MRVGGYEIVSELGAGAMGKVYLAEREGERAAVKVVHPHLLRDIAVVERFKREAEIGQRIDHPNVVRTLDVGSDFIAMEYVEGRDLRALLTALGTVPEALVREIAIQVAAGLQAIHDAGIVHRDLKPENVLITEANEVRITDLGIAKLQEASVVLTMEGEFAGSIGYTAPEQFDFQEVAPASDLYSLGVLLYELATGTNPFLADTVSVVIQRHLEHTPPRALDVNPDVTPLLSEAVATLLAKRPDDRFPEAVQLQAALEEGEAGAWWRSRETGRGQASIRVPRETGLYGRDRELASLMEAWEAGGLVVIEGEPGIGKTRLVADFAAGLDEAQVLYGAVRRGGGLDGLRDALRGRIGADVAPHLDSAGLVEPMAELLRTGTGLSGDPLRVAVSQIVRSLAREGPLLLVLDDLDRGPGELHDLALAVGRAAPDRRVLVVATGAPGMRLEGAVRISPERLGAADVLAMLRESLRSDALAERLGDRIAQKSDGVPYFVLEIVRELKTSALLREEEDTFVATRRIDEIAVPSTVADLLGARLRDLDTEDREILEVAALLGPEFDAGPIATVLETRRVRVLRRLAALERGSGLVRATGCVFRFDHNHVSETLASALPEELRREYHSLLADTGGDDAFLARHRLLGLDPAAGLAHVEPALAAAERAFRHEDTLAISALALDHLDGPARAPVLERRARCLEMLGEWDEHDAITAELRDSSDADVRARGLFLAGAREARTGNLNEAHALLDECLQLRRGAEERQAERTTLLNLAAVLYRMGRTEEAMERMDGLLRLARQAGDVAGECKSVGNLGAMLSYLTRNDEARARFEEQLALSRRHGLKQEEANALNNLGLLELQLGRFDEARACFERCVEVARETGYLVAVSRAQLNLGNVFLEEGRLADAFETYQRNVELCRRFSDVRGEAWAAGNVGFVLTACGQHDLAEPWFELQQRIGREVGEQQCVALALSGLGRVALGRGEDAAARACFEQLLESAREAGDADTQTEAHLYLAGLAEPADARRLREEALELAERAGLESRAKLIRAELGEDVPVEEIERLWVPDRISLLWHLWRSTGRREHLEAAHAILMDVRRHAPEEWRESLIHNVQLHREIVAAL